MRELINISRHFYQLGSHVWSASDPNCNRLQEYTRCGLAYPLP